MSAILVEFSFNLLRRMCKTLFHELACHVGSAQPTNRMSARTFCRLIETDQWKKMCFTKVWSGYSDAGITFLAKCASWKEQHSATSSCSHPHPYNTTRAFTENRTAPLSNNPSPTARGLIILKKKVSPWLPFETF